MWKILLIFGISFKVTLAVFGPECNVQKCASVLQNVKSLGHMIPDAVELKVICPDALEYIRCIITEIETCHHQNLADMASSRNESISGIANIFLGVSGLVIDLCDESSSLHKKYANHIICIRNTIDNAEVHQKCLGGFSESYENYAAIHRAFKKRDEHKDCFAASYVFACASEEVRKDCGRSSQELFMTVVKRTKLLKHSVCNPNAIVELKTTFFDFLELQGERRNIYKEAFDFRKKK